MCVSEPSWAGYCLRGGGGGIGDGMGITYVDAEVSNEGGVARTVRFLVDSGAAFTVLPQETWRALGLQPTRTVDFALADGSIIRRDVSYCFLKFQDVRAPTPVVLG